MWRERHEGTLVIYTEKPRDFQSFDRWHKSSNDQYIRTGNFNHSLNIKVEIYTTKFLYTWRFPHFFVV